MNEIRPLEKRDYAIATRVLRELASDDLSYLRFTNLADELAPVFGARDVSVVLNDPSDDADEPTRLWFREFGAEEIRRLVANSEEGNLGFRVFRRSGLRTCRIQDLSPGDIERLESSDFYRRFRSSSGLRHCLVTHLGTRPQESLGRLGYYRGEDQPDFDDERLTLLRMLHPELSAAARRFVASCLQHEQEELALINAAGQLIWMSEGFRFLWNAVEDRRMDYGSVAIHELVSAGSVGRAVAFHVINLGSAGSGAERPWFVNAPYRGGRGSLEVRFSVESGEHFGCAGQVLRVALIRSPRRETALRGLS